MIFDFRKREKHIEAKEKEIQRQKKAFHKDIKQTVKMQKRVNKLLSNGITLEILHATKGNK